MQLTFVNANPASIKILGTIEKGIMKSINYLKLAPALMKKVAIAVYSGASVIKTATISKIKARTFVYTPTYRKKIV